MPLVLIESPNKIKKLSQILGPSYKIMATVGHIADLPKSGLGIDLKTFEETYKVTPEKKSVVSDIKKEAKNHSIIYLATDPDREGEAIAHHISKHLPKRGVSIHRILFNSITKDAVEKAMKNPTSLDDNLYDAQRARRITDRLVGFKVSPVMWAKGLKGASAGRVQSVALRYISERECEIRAFKKEEFWKIKILTKPGFEAEFFEKDSKKFLPKNKKEADSIVKDVRKNKGSLLVSSYIKKSRSRKPYPPFITSTMQQVASGRFGWGAKKTMSVAQSIFSMGLITYHRTDSVRTEADKIVDVRDRIESKYGKSYLSQNTILYKDKNGSQGGHEAIRPTFESAPKSISSDEKKLLSLITNRFMASQMANAKFDQASIKLDCKGDGGTYSFKANGSVLAFDGFLKAYGHDSNDVILPPMSVGDKVAISKITPSQHFTQPPGRYTDASLIKKLEADGVGRPSTYASIIDTILKRKYVERKDKSFVCTETGIMVADFLYERFPKIVDATFTSGMEKSLDDISDGKSKINDFLESFFGGLSSDIKSAMKASLPESFEVNTKCPKCSDNMIKRISSHGPFLGCKKWPECDGVLSVDSEGNVPESVDTGIKCPDCSGLLMIRKGRSGNFYGCKSYPTCKFTAAIGENGEVIVKKKKPVKDTGVSCTKCKKGTMLERSGRYGKFYGCSKYPKCKNIMKSV